MREVPVAAQAMADADQTMARNGFPTFEQLAWADESTMGTEVWPTQVAVLLADHIMHAAITDARHPRRRWFWDIVMVSYPPCSPPARGTSKQRFE